MGRGVAIRRTVPPYQHHEGLFLKFFYFFLPILHFITQKNPNIAVEVFCSSLELSFIGTPHRYSPGLDAIRPFLGAYDFALPFYFSKPFLLFIISFFNTKKPQHCC
jgi:hypothetical protein